jgi:hypothetical protein
MLAKIAEPENARSRMPIDNERRRSEGRRLTGLDCRIEIEAIAVVDRSSFHSDDQGKSRA